MNEHPVTLHVMDDLRRSRLTVFFRFFLTFPHLFWLGLWTVVVLVVSVLNWLVALIIGRPAKAFQRFTVAYLRYSTTVRAYLFLIANPFPGFVGEPGSYPIELELPTTPEKQSRLKTLVRLLLVLPASAVSGVLLCATCFVAFLSWCAALITGRMPRGFRDLGANTLRYLGQVDAYLFLATGTYPSASPYVGMSLGAPVMEDAPMKAPAEVAPAEKAPAKKAAAKKAPEKK